MALFRELFVSVRESCWQEFLSDYEISFYNNGANFFSVVLKNVRAVHSSANHKAELGK